MKLLVTGYPPFDDFPLNSTHQLIESMIADPPRALADARGDVIFDIVEFDNTDTTTQKCTMLASYRKLIDEHEPDLCLFCGQAASRNRVALETIAINVFKGGVIEPEGPAAYWATLPAQDVLIERLKDAGIPAQLSYHAGTHLCNHILYAALHEAETRASGMKAGFLHLPMTATQVIECDENRPFIPLSMTRRALTLSIQHILSTPSSAQA